MCSSELDARDERIVTQIHGTASSSSPLLTGLPRAYGLDSCARLPASSHAFPTLSQTLHLSALLELYQVAVHSSHPDFDRQHSGIFDAVRSRLGAGSDTAPGRAGGLLARADRPKPT